MEPITEQDATWFRETYERIRVEVAKAVVGQDETVRGALVCLAANGHILLEGMPGLGKTLLVRTLSRALDLPFSRIQFTPDMMPADVTGTNILSQSEDGSRQFEFRRGPVFANVVLADEINRATPKTQSALLEAMQERSVTVGGTRHHLTEPFLVMATQNPVEQEGTYPLPEAQLDRFFYKVTVPFPTKQELAEVVLRTTGAAHAEPEPVANGEDVTRMRDVVRAVAVAPHVLDYGLTLVTATHPDSPDASASAKKYVRYGASPRAAQAIVTAARVYALLDGRFNVSKEDLKLAALPALRHRVLTNFEAEADGVGTDQIVADTVSHVDQTDRDPIRV